jgi:hypothetical protein
MITEQFTLVHCYKKDSVISDIVDRIRAECKIICPTAKEPKLGNHTTTFSPYLAPLDEMRYMTIGLRVQEILKGDVQVESNRVEVKSLDFFRNPGNDALVLMLKLSPEYEEFVNFWRANMHKFTNWKFPPLGEAFTPHICIVEQEGLYEKIYPHIRRIETLLDPISFHLPSPKVMIKRRKGKEHCWQEFDPMMGLK